MSEPHADRKRQQEEVSRQAQQAIEDMRWLMGTPAGRRIVWRQLDRCGVFRTSFTGNSETYFREGQRDIGLRLFTDISTACPDQFTVMLKEHRDDNRSPDARGSD